MLTGIFKIFGATCPSGGFFGIPTWYKYLDGVITKDPLTGRDVCTPQVAALQDIWLIVLAVIDMLLRGAIIIAIAFIVVGGLKFMTSQGQPDKIKAALGTIINACIGLVISIAAATIVAFVAGRFN